MNIIFISCTDLINSGIEELCEKIFNVIIKQSIPLQVNITQSYSNNPDWAPSINLGYEASQFLLMLFSSDTAVH